MSEYPRRNDMTRWCSTERALQNAIDEVEEMGCDQRLTAAVVLLGEAKNRVADFVDGVEQKVGTRAPMTAHCFAWLIEKACPGGPRWLKLDGRSVVWVADAFEALHFARKRDAESVAQAFPIACAEATITDHGFVGAPE